MNPIRVSFVAGETGEWRVDRVVPVRGATLPSAPAFRRLEGAEFFEGASASEKGPWVLHGVRSHERYVERGERERLVPVQEGLGRSESLRGTLIPIQKTAAWWELAQDERRAIFEARSRHIAIGLDYLPAVARRLYHCRDLGGPFDFLTWFEYAEASAGAFDDLLGRLRDTEEWTYVEREVEIRARREVATSR